MPATRRRRLHGARARLPGDRRGVRAADASAAAVELPARALRLRPPAADSDHADAHAPDSVELEPGELVVREGDPGGPLFIVEEGRLRAFQGSRAEEHNTQFLRTGDFFGELSLYLGVPRMASVAGGRAVPLAGAG